MELKPCPKCGGELGKRAYRRLTSDDKKEYYCHDCGTYFDKDMEEIIMRASGDNGKT